MRLQSVAQWVFNFFVLALLAGAMAGTGWLFAFAIREGATVVAASLAGLATVAAAVIVRYFERKKALEEARRQRLGPIYEQLASVLAGHDMVQRKREKMIADFTRAALIYAGPQVLKSFREWRDQLPSGEEWSQAESRANALRYESLVRAMRLDVGMSNRSLAEGDLGRSVLADYDDFFGAETEPNGPPEATGQEVRIRRTRSSDAHRPR